MTARLLAATLMTLAACWLVPAVADAGRPDPGRTQTFAHDSSGGVFPYVVYTPTTYRRSRPAPLVVITHGCQTTAEEQMKATLYNRVAERHGFVVLYPDIDELGTQQPGPLRNCWRFPAPTSQHRGGGDAAALAAMTRAVMDKRRIDPERVYMAGMSAGGFMTSIMAAAYPDLYAAVAVVAAGAYADGTCLAQNAATLPAPVSAQRAFAESGPRARVVPRLVVGGGADQGIPPACADKALEQGLRTNNLVLSGTQTGPIPLEPTSVRAVETPDRRGARVSSYRDPDGCLVGRRWLIDGMNHFWPGGSFDPDLASFVDPSAPNGARITWRFLRKFTKTGTAMPCAESRSRH